MTRPRCFYVFSDSPVDHAEEDCGTHQVGVTRAHLKIRLQSVWPIDAQVSDPA
jgi:hypothetical protein